MTENVSFPSFQPLDWFLFYLQKWVFIEPGGSPPKIETDLDTFFPHSKVAY